MQIDRNRSSIEMSYKFIQYITTTIKQYYNKQHYNNNIKAYKIVVQLHATKVMITAISSKHAHAHTRSKRVKSADTTHTHACIHTTGEHSLYAGGNCTL